MFVDIQQQGETSRSRSPQNRARIPAPATQIVKNNSPHKRQQPKVEVPIPRLTRSQARSPERGLDNSTLPASVAKRREQATQIITRRPANPKKRAIGPSPPPPPGKDPSKQPTQIIAAGPSKKAKTTALAKLNNKKQTAPVPKSVTRTTKRKQLVVILPTQFRDTPIPKCDPDDTHQSAAESSKISTWKSAPKFRPCVPCSQRHRACDRGQPVCGFCAKPSRGQTCVYPQPHASPTRSVKKTTESLGKGLELAKGIADDSESHKRITATHGTSGPTFYAPQKMITRSNPVTVLNELARGSTAERISVSSLRSPKSENFPSAVRAGDTGPGVSGTGSDTTVCPSQRPVPDIKEFDTFLRTKRNNPGF